MIHSAEHVRAYAGRYRDMFPIRLLSVVGIVILAIWLMDWRWGANFAISQLSLYALLWRVVDEARRRPGVPDAWKRLKRATEAITLGLATHTSLFVLAAWWFEPQLVIYLAMLIVGNLMVGALQVHVGRLSFAAAVVPPATAIGIMAWRLAGDDPILLISTALFVVGVAGAAWRQATSDRETVELYVDLSDRTSALGRALGEAQEERAAAERANLAKSRFLAMISHEVRTPLNVILGITEVLKRRKRPMVEAALVDDMADAGGMLLRLLNGALDLSKIESGQSNARLEPMDLRAQLAAIARVWRSRVAELGLTLQVECHGDPAHFVVRSDAARLEQVVINFLSNALKLTPEGGIRIVASAQPDGRGHVVLRVEVHDQGPGVPADQRDRIFEPFEQLADGRAAGGAGLGLAICRTSIEALGGRLGVRPALPKGSVFWFEIVAARAETVTIDAAPETTGAATRGLRVLAAEDHPANRKLLRLLLDQFGAETILVENGAAAVEAVRAGTFDLVLMDVMMPVMDGVEALKVIRTDEADNGRSRTTVHMLTANVFDEDVARYMAAGADGVLRKPIEIQALHQALSDTAAAGRVSA